MLISPDNPHHKSLEAKVKEHLINHGYLIDELTYHSKLNEEMAEILKRTNNPTALCIRTRADRIAQHKTGNITFEFEAKTHASKRQSDMCFEAVPICHHLAESKMGVKCLYAYHNPFENHDYGFWIDDMPDIDFIFMPSNWGKEAVEWFESVFKLHLPKTKIIGNRPVRGSGDPFIVIKNFSHLQHWKKLIDDITLTAEAV